MNEPTGLGTNVVTQVGIIVKDIEAMLDRYVQVFQLPERPKVIITDTVDQAHTQLRGESTPARAKLAFIHMGQVQLELIEPDGQPSVWQEHLDRYGESVHHIAFQVKGTNQVVKFLQGHGISVDQQGDYTGGMYTYVNSMPALGVTLELLENF